jgi:putative membrane protein
MVSGLLIFLLIGIVFSVLSWLRFRFRIVSDRVLVRSGVFHREELSIEFGRVQNVSIREPFYMRPFGLAVLGIDTAGSTQKEIVLGGIKMDLAIQLRETILSKAKTETDDQEADSKPVVGPTLLLTRGVSDIVIYGLTVNFILWFVIALGAFFGAADVSERALSWLADRIQLEHVISATQNSVGLLGSILLLTGLVLAIFLLLPLISVLGALFRHYGYELGVEGETYRKSGGLLTRHDESMKRHKIQALVLKQNFAALFFKRINMQLRVASAGSGVESGQLPTPGRATFLVPALHEPEARKLATEFFPACDMAGTRFSRINRHRMMILVLALMAVPVLAVTTSLSLLLSWKFLAIAPLAYAIAWSAVTRYWKKTGYAVVGEYGFVRHGFIGTETTVFPLFKVQRVDIHQTQGQRRKGLAHLGIHLASHSLKIPYVPIEDAQKFRDLALYYVESSDQAWY